MAKKLNEKLDGKKWEHGMSFFCRPFTTAKIRYFDKTEADKADAWLAEV